VRERKNVGVLKPQQRSDALRVSTSEQNL